MPPSNPNDGALPLKQVLEAMKHNTIEAPLTYDVESQREIVTRMLSPEEKIVWYGQPDIEITKSRSGGSLVPIICGVFCGAVAAALGLTNAANGGMALVMAVLAVLCIPWAFRAPNFWDKTARTTLWVVTTRRVYKLSCMNPIAQLRTPVKWMMLPHLEDLYSAPKATPIKDKPGRADIEFARHTKEWADGDSTLTVYTMEAIREPDAAIAAIKKLIDT